MRYSELKESIQNALLENPAGLTWLELKSSLKLPYKIPCQTWIYQLEEEIHLERANKIGRAMVWKLIHN